MGIDPGFAFAQPRMQARHGRQVDAATWSEAETSIDLGRCLQVFRGSPLRPWVSHFSANAKISDIERHIRDDWRAYIDEVTAWAPAAWRPALQWSAALVYLPLLAHLIAGSAPPQWLATDAPLASLVTSDAQSRRAALGVTELAPLAAVDDTDELLSAWFAHWHAVMPRKVGHGTREGLTALQDAARTHVDAVASAAVPAGAAELRRRFRQQLQRLFRRHAISVVAMFSHLALTALDIERLRGALIASRLRGVGDSP